MSLFSDRSRSISLSGSQGFTMVELIIAIAVFSIGLVGAYMMLDRTVFLASASQDEIIAANLMRGDIEEIKNLRDSNWVKLQNYNSFVELGGATNHLSSPKTYIIYEQVAGAPPNQESKLRLVEKILPADILATKLCRQLDTPKYGYCDSTYTTPTKYRKYLKVEGVLNDSSGTPPTADLPNALKITSIIETDRPKRTYTLSTIITDWKKQ